MRASILMSLALMSGAVNAHPFDSAIHSLAKAAADLEAGARANRNKEVVQKANEIRVRASALWLEAAVAPITLGDEKMKRLGFFLATINGGPAEFYIAKSEAAARANEELMDLNASRWVELGNLIRRQQADVAELTTIVDRRDQLMGIEERDRKQANFQTMRIAALNQFRQFVDQASGCVEFFKKAFKASGLAPEKNGKSYGWSAAELTRVYGLESLDEVSGEQSEQIRSRIQELLAKAHEYDHACISHEQSAFFDIEQKKLGKKSAQ